MRHRTPATVLLALACACATVRAEPPVGDDPQALSSAPHGCLSVQPPRCTPVNDHALAQVRGGYDFGGGLQVSFGITRATYVNGELVAQSQLTVRDLVARAQGPAAAAVAWTTEGHKAIQLGAGNSVRMDQLPMGALVIQNSLDNQNIRNVTVVDATTNSLQMLRGANALGSLRDVLTMPSASR